MADVPTIFQLIVDQCAVSGKLSEKAAVDIERKASGAALGDATLPYISVGGDEYRVAG